MDAILGIIVYTLIVYVAGLYTAYRFWKNVCL